MPQSFTPVQIAPSLLSADFMHLGRDVALIEQANPDWLHVDVMDGHFVPNLTIGPPLVKALKHSSAVPLDVHLMVTNPERQLDWFMEAGADLLTIHLECANAGEHSSLPGTSSHVDKVERPAYIENLVARIQAAGRLAGLAINPGTPAELLLPYLQTVDLVLVMSVHPGFGGQSFIDASLAKLALVAAARSDLKTDLLIEVDGGINTQTAALAAAAGADLLVAGNAIFAAADPLAALASIRAAASPAPAPAPALPAPDSPAPPATASPATAPPATAPPVPAAPTDRDR